MLRCQNMLDPIAKVLVCGFQVNSVKHVLQKKQLFQCLTEQCSAEQCLVSLDLWSAGLVKLSAPEKGA